LLFIHSTLGDFAEHPSNNDICYKEQFVERGIGVGTDCKSARSGQKFI